MSCQHIVFSQRLVQALSGRPLTSRRDAVLRSEIPGLGGKFPGLRRAEVLAQLGREGIAVAGCTTARQIGLWGAILGKAVTTTIGNPAAPPGPNPRQGPNRDASSFWPYNLKRMNAIFGVGPRLSLDARNTVHRPPPNAFF